MLRLSNVITYTNTIFDRQEKLEDAILAIQFQEIANVLVTDFIMLGCVLKMERNFLFDDSVNELHLSEKKLKFWYYELKMLAEKQEFLATKMWYHCIKQRLPISPILNQLNRDVDKSDIIPCSEEE